MVTARRPTNASGIRLLSIALALLSGCAAADHRPSSHLPVAISELTLFDGGRQRPVSVRLYGRDIAGRRKPLAIISHGYGGHNDDYSFLASHLVARGYLVASIEHLDRPGDPPMASEGDLAKLRRPVWQIGADSISFVIAELTRQGLSNPAGGAVIIGHSNGGDMTMLFAAEHPEQVRIALSLDNRRMVLPRVRKPKICSLRSTDQSADPRVLPSSAEQAALGISVVAVPVRHADMSDAASTDQKAAMLKAVDRCISDLPAHKAGAALS